MFISRILNGNWQSLLSLIRFNLVGISQFSRYVHRFWKENNELTVVLCRDRWIFNTPKNTHADIYVYILSLKLFYTVSIVHNKTQTGLRELWTLSRKLLLLPGKHSFLLQLCPAMPALPWVAVFVAVALRQTQPAIKPRVSLSAHHHLCACSVIGKVYIFTPGDTGFTPDLIPNQ